MLDKLLFAIEKFAALLTSQRTLTTVVGVIVVVGMAWAIIAPLMGIEGGELPSEEALEASIGQWLAVIATAVTSMIAVLRMVSSLVEGMNERPPTLKSEDYEGIRK